MAGTLFVVATPIGNLEDLTFRALRTLKEVDLVAAEDTRRSSKLLAHYGISKPLVSLREHNEAREAAKLVARLKTGQNVAFVSDAGTPGIADPGARLVRAARSDGIQVVPIPGPSALTAALSVSGLDTSEFTFKGFPPAARIARKKWFESLNDVLTPFVFLEAPHRISESVADARQELVNRQILVFRELTKVNEQLVIWPINTGSNDPALTELGEFTVVVGPRQSAAPIESVDQVSAGRLYSLIHDSGLVPEENVASCVAAAFRIDPKAALKAAKKGRILVKRQSESAS